MEFLLRNLRRDPTEQVSPSPQKGFNRVGVSLPSNGGENRSSIRNVTLSIYLEHRTIDKDRRYSDFEFHTLLSEPFKIYM
jgi:hypothetical protein